MTEKRSLVFVAWRRLARYLQGMARIEEPTPGRVIVSIIYSSMDAVAESLGDLERRFGRVEFETSGIPCSNAKRYREEMGDNLHRRFFSFERTVNRAALAELKSACMKIEPRYADQVHDFLFRTVNIDPGILTPENLVMASHVQYNHRVYMGNKVFAELALVWAKGKFMRLPWTNRDFCHDEAVDFFERIRNGFEVVSEPV